MPQALRQAATIAGMSTNEFMLVSWNGAWRAQPPREPPPQPPPAQPPLPQPPAAGAAAACLCAGGDEDEVERAGFEFDEVEHGVLQQRLVRVGDDHGHALEHQPQVFVLGVVEAHAVLDRAIGCLTRGNAQRQVLRGAGRSGLVDLLRRSAGSK